MASAISVCDLTRALRPQLQLRFHQRNFGKSVAWTPKLKEMLKPPPRHQKTKPKSPLPKISDINIPQRINRGPTDVLRALASTVGRDYTAPHYKFHDDPYLIPNSNIAKRSYALSKEAGRKAAKWIKEQHRDLFIQDVAEPPIEAYFPRPVFTENSDLTEENLSTYLDQGLLEESIQIYNILESKGKSISEDSMQSLLELICYYNEVPAIDDDLVEERWYKSAQMSKEKLTNTWKNVGLAEKLFSKLDNPPLSAICAIIRGRAKFNQADKAWSLFMDMCSKGLVPDTDTYNYLIKISVFLKENSELRWNIIEELLKHMNDNGVFPNIGTLNAVLQSLSRLGDTRKAIPIALSTLSEFRKLSVLPCLASYYHLLTIFYKDRNSKSYILSDILREAQGTAFSIQDPNDIYFFVTAMEVARNHLHSLEVAHKIHELLHFANNYDLIGDSFKESVYYRHYFLLRCGQEPFNDFMTFYNMYVPNIYTPEPSVVEETLKSLEISSAFEYVPKMWSDIVIFEQSLRENLIELILQIMASYKPENNNQIGHDVKHENLTTAFAKIGTEIWKIVESQDPEKPRKVLWSGSMLGNLLLIFTRGERLDYCAEIVKKAISPSAAAEVVGVISLDALREFLTFIVTQNDGVICLALLQYMNDCGFPEVTEFGEEIQNKVTLDSIQTARLSTLTNVNIGETHEKEITV